MNSLFARVLLWFWATLVLSNLGALYLNFEAIHAGNSYPVMSPLITYQLQEARLAYETGGREGLQQFMHRFHAVFAGEGILTDASGRDLLGGADESALLARVQKSIFPPFSHGGTVFARESPDHRFWFFFVVHNARLGTWLFLPQRWWAITVGILSYYLLAGYLTRPVRRLQQAMERFGRGDLSARAASARRDELGQLARAFDRMADRIQTLVDAERRLLLDISHELRSPLARLRVAVELARSGQHGEMALNRIDREAERLNGLVSGLLDVTRAEGDPQAMRRQPVRLDQFLEELIADEALEAQAGGGSLHLEGVPAIVTGDPELLRRALENVLRNAIRHAPANTAVETRLETNNGAAVISVRDYGTGVPDEALARIFDAFYRVESDRDRASGGAGLGLSIARRALELHAGRIRARNVTPGLLVEIELPLTEPGNKTAKLFHT